jgi:hypothetical protein
MRYVNFKAQFSNFRFGFPDTLGMNHFVIQQESFFVLFCTNLFRIWQIRSKKRFLLNDKMIHPESIGKAKAEIAEHNIASRFFRDECHVNIDNLRIRRLKTTKILLTQEIPILSGRGPFCKF